MKRPNLRKIAVQEVKETHVKKRGKEKDIFSVRTWNKISLPERRRCHQVTRSI